MRLCDADRLMMFFPFIDRVFTITGWEYLRIPSVKSKDRCLIFVLEYLFTWEYIYIEIMFDIRIPLDHVWSSSSWWWWWWRLKAPTMKFYIAGSWSGFQLIRGKKNTSWKLPEGWTPLKMYRPTIKKKNTFYMHSSRQKVCVCMYVMSCNVM